MTKKTKKPVALECEDWFYLSLREISCSYGVSKELILEIIDEGIVTPQRDEKEELLFDSEAVKNIGTVLRLNRDLGVNWAGAGLALELLEEIEHLKRLLAQKL
ncbi:chaperone modulator CbpM [Legionella clemsonensis]|uniref:Chaperone modulatory protein CbpM n=1 Tax=Legionella clemsonensis TaxID=1867846 RepID=A0A222P067_9GAMM|nr:chaperone modulator CbpM [Legionella clemsonensis]ASQ45216.1 Chaperone modulatory protein CbpM [Legionella clemsonensis]